MILNRVAEYYLNRIKQSYDISINVFRDGDKAAQPFMNIALENGEPIAEGSRFYFIDYGNGNTCYMGLFMYYRHGTGLTRVFLQIEPDSNKEGRGYYRILGHFAKPGDVNIPPYYSYAKYNRGRLASYKGTYPYPNKYAFDFGQGDDYAVYRTKKHTHFIKRISDEEMIVISRPQRNIMTFCVAFSYLFLILMLFTMLLTSGKKRTKAFRVVIPHPGQHDCGEHHIRVPEERVQHVQHDGIPDYDCTDAAGKPHKAHKGLAGATLGRI